MDLTKEGSAKDGLIMLDFDCTIADPLSLFAEILLEKTGIKPNFKDLHHTPSDVVARKMNLPVDLVMEAADIAFRSVSYIDRIHPFPYALESINKLESLGYRFKIVSARFDSRGHESAGAWLEKHNLSHIPLVFVPVGETKEAYVAGCTLGVDDIISNLEDMKRVVPNLILLDHYHLGYETDFHKAHSWKEVTSLIEKLV